MTNYDKIKDEFYILNPKYMLHHDKTRTILTIRDPYGENFDVEEEFSSFIHPVHAMILSFFNGKKTLNETLIEVANFIELEISDIRQLIMSIINTPKENATHVSFNKKKLYFPWNLLIKKKKSIKIYTYKQEDFLFNKLDIETKRLNTPLDITLMTNTNCFTDCSYCYADRPIIKPSDFLSIDRIRDLISEAKFLKMRKFDIMGGDLFLYKHWKILLKELVDKDFTPYISTKIPLSCETIDYLNDIGLTRIQISLDSLDPLALNKLLGVNPNYIQKMIKSIKYLNNFDIDINVNTILTKINGNKENIDSILKLLTPLKNIKSILFNTAGYSIYKNNYEEIKLSKTLQAEFVSYVNGIRDKFDFRVGYSDTYTDAICENNYRDKLFNDRSFCTANINTMFVLPNGDVTICEELFFNPQFIMGNLKNNSIQEVWSENSVNWLMNKENFSNESICKKCEDFENCHSNKGVCWKEIIYAYGEKNWCFPDPKCPKAPQYHNKFYLV